MHISFFLHTKVMFFQNIPIRYPIFSQMQKFVSKNFQKLPNLVTLRQVGRVAGIRLLKEDFTKCSECMMECGIFHKNQVSLNCIFWALHTLCVMQSMFATKIIFWSRNRWYVGLATVPKPYVTTFESRLGNRKY